MNHALTQLHPYPFEKMRLLLSDIWPDTSLRPLTLSIDESRNPSPELVSFRLGLVWVVISGVGSLVLLNHFM